MALDRASDGTDRSDPVNAESDWIDVEGPEDAQPVVFLHGTIFNHTMWAPQRDALAEEYRVIAPDLPGHGARAAEEFRLEAGVATAERVVDELADGSAHVVGLSLGGYVATEFARRHPEAVDRLVLSGSSANPVGVMGVLARVVGEVTLLAARSERVERAVDRLSERYVRSRDLSRESIEEIVASGFDLEPFGRAGREIAGVDFRSALAAFGGPVLLCNGRRDLVMRLGEDAHADAAGAEVQTVGGAGHTVNLDRPAAYTRVLERFLEPAAVVGASD